MVASDQRKYYVVPTTVDHSGALMPDTTVPGWTARYLSDDVAIVRDPEGAMSYPVLGVDVPVEVALENLPLELPLTMSQTEADSVCDSLGLSRVDISQFKNDRVGGK